MSSHSSYSEALPFPGSCKNIWVVGNNTATRQPSSTGDLKGGEGDFILKSFNSLIYTCTLKDPGAFIPVVVPAHRHQDASIQVTPVTAGKAPGTQYPLVRSEHFNLRWLAKRSLGSSGALKYRQNLSSSTIKTRPCSNLIIFCWHHLLGI